MEKLNQLKELFNLIREAPEGLQEYLVTTFWVLIWVTLLSLILKILLNKEFKYFYSLLGGWAKNATKISKAITNEALKNLELPEPYPRLTKFLTIISMVNSYLGAFFFTCFFLALSGIFVLSTTSSFLARNSVLLFAMVCVYFAWFLFVQAEKERIKLFSKSDQQS
jgi:hypothetical protein